MLDSPLCCSTECVFANNEQDWLDDAAHRSCSGFYFVGIGTHNDAEITAVGCHHQYLFRKKSRPWLFCFWRSQGHQFVFLSKGNLHGYATEFFSSSCPSTWWSCRTTECPTPIEICTTTCKSFPASSKLWNLVSSPFYGSCTFPSWTFNASNLLSEVYKTDRRSSSWSTPGIISTCISSAVSLQTRENKGRFA